ncbi:MAG: hypothetical protein J07AB43_09020 [Candidatus Nanosalina sp. J07AB43]|nr:MAG: hypothetical protein J07AB43_09020 [Candidatus Nanosalina sp. J07AB43]
MNRKGVSTSIEVLVMMLGAIGAGGMATQTATSLDTDSNISSNLSEDQAEGIVNQFQNSVESLTRKVGTEVRVYKMTSNKSSIPEGAHNIKNYGNLHLHIENVGETTVNTTSFRLDVLTGQNPSGNCFEPSNSTVLEPRDVYVCNTGIVFPRATQEVELKVVLKGSAKERTVRCLPEVSGQTYC